MKYITILLFVAVTTLATYGQVEKVKGRLFSDTTDLKIINVYPDSFPNISVVFKAERRNGEPLWNLTKDKMKVQENTQHCNVVSLEQISKNKPINIGIVIDHSGSMQYDDYQLYDKSGNYLLKFDENGSFIYPNNYIAPIDNAKSAVKTFASSFNTRKDFISVIGFSRTVDKKLPLTQDISKINLVVDSMVADYSTALYDAMIFGIEEIKNANGIKVLVVLTDGQDNSSQSKWTDVIERATITNIPVYIIGLGDVNVDILKSIADSTKGQFYFTQSSNSLNTVYAEISRQVQAFYNLVYHSTNFSSADSSRTIELSFDIDSIYLVTDPVKTTLPLEVVEFIAGKEKEKQYILYGGIALCLLVGSGILLFYFKRKK